MMADAKHQRDAAVLLAELLPGSERLPIRLRRARHVVVRLQPRFSRCFALLRWPLSCIVIAAVSGARRAA